MTDDAYLPYLTILLDEIFGRFNRLYLVTFKQGSATGHKAINPGMVTTTNFILVYSKLKTEWKPNRIFTDRGGRDKRYGNYIMNIKDNYSNWKIITLTEAFASYLNVSIKEARAIMRNEPQRIDNFVRNNCESVIQLVNPDYKSVGAETRKYIDRSRANPEKIFVQRRKGLSDIILIRGKRIIFYKNKLKKIDGKYVTGEPLTTLWDDLLSNNLHNEGGVDFPKGKKPESLIKRCLEISTKEGDWVLDSFLGSGTTASVAHKMNRKWIGIEMGQQAYTHCKMRLDSVIDNTDHNGISKAVNWQGGGGYHFYELAPSLLVKNDKLPIYQINPTYSYEMLCEAICKIEGFRYIPQDVFCGQSSEKRFLHVTTEFVNAEYIRSLSQHLAEGQSLLVYTTKMQSNMILPDNIEIKLIPKDLLEKCDFESEVR